MASRTTHVYSISSFDWIIIGIDVAENERIRCLYEQHGHESHNDRRTDGHWKPIDDKFEYMALIK
jgi:hypothetical protein